jgi:sec-independent protein translocase protein TatB
VFNIGPMELVVLAVVGLIVLGPDRLPTLARDAARMIRTLREMATGARSQLREELGPEFADLDLRSLNPRTAIQRALLGEDDEDAKPRPETNGSANGHSPMLRKTQQPPLGRDEPAPFDEDTT